MLAWQNSMTVYFDIRESDGGNSCENSDYCWKNSLCGPNLVNHQDDEKGCEGKVHAIEVASRNKIADDGTNQCAQNPVRVVKDGNDGEVRSPVRIFWNIAGRDQGKSFVSDCVNEGKLPAACSTVFFD